MGAFAKLLYKQLVSCLALRAISSKSPPPSSCCRKIKISVVFIYVLAVYAFHFRFITFREQHSFLILTPDTTLHFHYKHTPQHRTALGKYSFPFRRLHTFRFPTSLSHSFPMVFLFSAKCLPQKHPQYFPTTL